MPIQYLRGVQDFECLRQQFDRFWFWFKYIFDVDENSHCNIKRQIILIKKQMVMVILDLILRDIDGVAVKKIDSLAKKKGLSRQVYLKNYLNVFAFDNTAKENEDKYANAINQIAIVIKENTNVLLEIKHEFLFDKGDDK